MGFNSEYKVGQWGFIVKEEVGVGGWKNYEEETSGVRGTLAKLT